MELVTPATAHLPSFRDALGRGWHTGSADSDQVVAQVRDDPDGFVAQLNDRDPRDRRVTLPDGTSVPRIPQIERWMWDGEFCGVINLRWQSGTTELPPTCLGHIGYSVVPWRRRRGYATAALGQMLCLARDAGLPWVEVTTDVENLASQRVILANGGALVEHFDKPEVLGGGPALRYRISLTA